MVLGKMIISMLLIVSTVGGMSVPASIKIGGESCPYPSQLKPNYDFNWKSKSGEWANTVAKTEYMMLALSW